MVVVKCWFVIVCVVAFALRGDVLCFVIVLCVNVVIGFCFVWLCFILVCFMLFRCVVARSVCFVCVVVVVCRVVVL